MEIRLATREDLAEIDEIYKSAKQFMRATGNANQWSTDYPSALDAEWGIENGTSYVCTDGGEVVATFAFGTDGEPTYNKIYEGEWKNSEPYAYIHRIAVKHHGRGIVAFCFEECFKRFPNLKIDTHRDNIPMQKALLRSGFEYCGIIYLESGDERLAYQKIR